MQIEPKKEKRPVANVRWWQSLQFSLSFILVSFLVLFSSISIITILNTGKSLILDESVKLIERTGNEVVAKLLGRITLTEALTTSLANMVEILPSSSETIKGALPHVINYEQRGSFIAGGGVWPEPFTFDPTRERRSFFWGRDHHGNLMYYDDYNDPQGPGYHGEEWYVPARYVQEGGSYWSKSYMDPYSLQPMVTCSIPMMLHHKFIGVATIDLKLEGLDAFFKENAKQSGGYIFAVDRNNKFLSFPQEGMVKAKPDESKKSSQIEFLTIYDLAEQNTLFEPFADALREVNNQITKNNKRLDNYNNKRAAKIADESYQIELQEAELISAIIADPFDQSNQNSTLFTSFQIPHDYFLDTKALVHIFLVPSTYWRVIIVTPYDQAIAASNSITHTLIKYLLVGSLFSFILLFIATRKLVILPLQKMTSALAGKHDHDNDYAIQLEHSGNNELGLLANQFNILNSELLQTYKKSRKSEKKYRALFENLQDVLYQTDLEGRLTLASPSAYDMFGYDTEDIIGKKFSSDFYKYPSKRNEFVHKLKKNGKVEGFEVELVRKDGSSFWVSANARLLLDETGGPYGIEGIIRDIDEKVRHEQIVESLQLHLKNILDSMPSMLITINGEGIITQYNSAAVNSTGIKAEKAIGNALSSTLPFLDHYQKYYQNVVESKQPVEFFRESIPDLDNNFYNITLFPLVSDGVDGMAIRMDDISELQKKEQQLIQVQKMETIGTLAGGIAHDFNNLLSGIIGTLSLVRRRIDHDNITAEDMLRYLDTLEMSGQRAADLVKQLLSITRSQELSLTPVDLNEVIKNVMNICLGSFDKSVELAPHYHETPAVIKADTMQIEQVVLNLCVNGAHAMTIMRPPGAKQGGKLELRISQVDADKYFCLQNPEAKEGAYWCLSVSDTGVGMSAQTIQKIFNPFFTTKDKYKGTGLGLSTAYNIIQQHNGFVNVYSEPGNGTSFRLYIPALSTEELNDVPEQQSQVTQGKGTILLVDDEEVVRELGTEMLKVCGYNVLVAENGQQCLEVYKSHSTDIDCVLLDLLMPVMSGIDTYPELKKLNPELKVIVTSGFKEDERAVQLMEMGAHSFIQKPYTLQQLSQKIAALLGK